MISALCLPLLAAVLISVQICSNRFHHKPLVLQSSHVLSVKVEFTMKELLFLTLVGSD